MKKYTSIILVLFLAFAANAQSTQPIRNMMLGAHPDDCDQGGGGTAILLTAMGYKVKFVSVTNGDAGHQSSGGGVLAKRRMQEAMEAGKRFGVEYEVLDNHDGELLPSLHVRLQVIRKIREWNADVVIAPRPNDYHPDHRYAGVLVQDAAYMVAVPNVAADTPPLKKNPVFLYFEDRFQKPNPFEPDIAIDISSVFDQKIFALEAHQSQFYEWLPWIGGYADEVPVDAAGKKQWLAKREAGVITPAIRQSLEKWYGKERAAQVKQAETFEICEYGQRPSEDYIRKIFPMLKK